MEIKTLTTEEQKKRLKEIRGQFGKTVFFGTPEADEMIKIEAELIAKNELYPAFYSEE